MREWGYNGSDEMDERPGDVTITPHVHFECQHLSNEMRLMKWEHRDLEKVDGCGILGVGVEYTERKLLKKSTPKRYRSESYSSGCSYFEAVQGLYIKLMYYVRHVKELKITCAEKACAVNL